MAELMEAIGEADLIEDFEYGRVEGVATELPVEVLMRFEQRNRNPLANEEQRQDHSAWPASDDAARGFLHVKNIFNNGLAGCVRSARVGRSAWVLRSARVFDPAATPDRRSPRSRLHSNLPFVVISLRIRRA
jgi:hypothetical protein